RKYSTSPSMRSLHRAPGSKPRPAGIPHACGVSLCPPPLARRSRRPSWPVATAGPPWSLATAAVTPRLRRRWPQTLLARAGWTHSLPRSTTKERHAAARGPGTIRGSSAAVGTLPLEARRAWRVLARSPGSSLLAVLCLGLGIGLHTTMFAGADPWLFRPLPYAAPDELVGVREVSPQGTMRLVSPPIYFSLHDESASFPEVGAVGRAGFNLSPVTEPGL